MTILNEHRECTFENIELLPEKFLRQFVLDVLMLQEYEQPNNPLFLYSDFILSDDIADAFRNRT